MKIVNKNKFIRSISILIITIIAIISIAIRMSELNSVKYSEEKYTVQAGDTLWKIAEENANESETLQEYIYKIKKVNNIDSTLKVGQEIIIFK